MLSTSCTRENQGVEINDDLDTDIITGDIIGDEMIEEIVTEPLEINIERYPLPNPYSRGMLTTIPEQNTDFQYWSYDFRSYDISEIDFAETEDVLNLSDFDTNTVWPEQLPVDFNPEAVMELGRNPGLGVYDLHARGITGEGVSIAIIDQPLIIDHDEYSDNIIYYQEYNIETIYSEMHGPAVTSILCGETSGVAPGVNVFYIAMRPGEYISDEYVYDYAYVADCINIIIDLNETLDPSYKIRAISLSLGWKKNVKGYSELMTALNRAIDNDLFIVSTSINSSYDINLVGLGRDVNDNPEDFENYKPGLFWEDYYDSAWFNNEENICIPMDSRTTASDTGRSEYVFYNSGGLSWAVPYFTGVYALACQVDNDITPQEFISIVKETSREIDLVDNDGQLVYHKIIDPVAIVDTLETRMQ